MTLAPGSGFCVCPSTRGLVFRHSMGKRFSDEHFWKMRFLIDEGFNCTQIGTRLGVAPRTVRYWKASKFPPSGVTRKSPAPKPPTETLKRRRLAVRWATHVERLERIRYTPKWKKKVVKVFARRPYSSPRRIARKINLDGELRRKVSPSTVRRDLLRAGLKAYVRKRQPPLTDKAKAARVEFCKWALKNRPIILFSDEKLFNTDDHTSRHEWCLPGQRPTGKDKQQCGGPETLWLWGVIGPGFSEFVTLQRCSIDREMYRDGILSHVLEELKCETAKSPKVYFMQDNAKPHAGAVDWLERRGIRCLPVKWPAHSPDINPIEQLWEKIQFSVSEKAPFSAEHLRLFIDTWIGEEMDQKSIDKSCRAFFSRCKRVIDAGGEMIKP
jgi:hypothetical protein